MSERTHVPGTCKCHFDLLPRLQRNFSRCPPCIWHLRTFESEHILRGVKLTLLYTAHCLLSSYQVSWGPEIWAWTPSDTFAGYTRTTKIFTQTHLFLVLANLSTFFLSPSIDFFSASIRRGEGSGVTSCSFHAASFISADCQSRANNQPLQH